MELGAVEVKDEPSVVTSPYEGLSGRNILKRMASDNEEGIKRASKIQSGYAKRICETAGLEYPSELFGMEEREIDEMMVQRLTSGTTSARM